MIAKLVGLIVALASVITCADPSVVVVPTSTEGEVTTTTIIVDEPTTTTVVLEPTTTTALVTTTTAAPTTTTTVFVVSNTFTMNPGIVHQGQPITFDGSALPCTPGPCSYTWQWFFRSGTRTILGGQMGRTPTITYSFSAQAASQPFVIVQLTIGQGRIIRPQLYTSTFTVLPLS
jgi:hypothetical protein